MMLSTAAMLFQAIIRLHIGAKLPQQQAQVFQADSALCCIVSQWVITLTCLQIPAVSFGELWLTMACSAWFKPLQCTPKKEHPTLVPSTWALLFNTM